MRLKQWVAQQGRGELTRLQHETKIAYSTLSLLASDHHVARYPTAVAISKATGGAVSIAELCELPPPPPPQLRSTKAAADRPKPKRKRARRAPSSAVSVAPAARA